MFRLSGIALCLLALLQACQPASDTSSPGTETPSSPQKVEESQATSSPQPASKAQEVPYVIQDSSNVLDLGNGLLVYFIKKGTGPAPSLQRNVLFHYHGMLTDGTVFDSSFERGQPLDSPLQRLIRGWQIALEKVPLGSQVKLRIPPELGYGAQGSTNVPPNATLIFDIELISMY